MKGKTAGIVMAIGGLVMAVGPLLTFVTVETPVGSQSFSGLASEIGDDGKVYLGVGIGLLVFGVVVAIVRSALTRRILGVLGILAAGFMTYAGIVDVTSIDDDIPAELAAQFTISAGIGLYLALLGAVIALIGSGMALVARSDDAGPAGAPPPPPPTSTEAAPTHEPPPPA